MRIAEEFARCEECNEGWFEELTFVLVQKDSPKDVEPMFLSKKTQLQCTTCGHIQYTYNEYRD